MSGMSKNYLFYPEGGGNDLESVRQGKNPDEIELETSNFFVVRPKSLHFHLIPGKKAEWSFFLLKVEGLQRSGLYTQGQFANSSHEPIAEFPDGTWHDVDCVMSGEFMGQHGPMPTPAGTRVLNRQITSGTFALFCKASGYNLGDIRRQLNFDPVVQPFHNTMSEHEFLAQIQAWAPLF